MKTTYLLEKLVFSVPFAMLILSCVSNPTNVNAAGFELVNDVSIVKQEARDQQSLHLTIAVGNRLERLVLVESSALRDAMVIDQNGAAAVSATKAYEGVIENIPNSWVRVSINGAAVDGVLDTGTERLFITSKPAPAPERRIRSFGSAIDKILHAPSKARTTQEVVQIPVDEGFDSTAERVTKVAKIAIVVDSFYNEALGGRGLSEAISTINTVDGLYQQEFGIALKVDTAMIITDDHTLNLSNESLEDNLTRFRDYRLGSNELPPELALVHLFTGVRTDDPLVGLAYLDSACREDGYDISISTPFEFPVLLTAHEIGHNLGAQHDEQTELCALNNDQLMYSQINVLTTRKFSTCSRDAINTHLHNGACYSEAIDLSLTLTRDGASDVIAVITNTDSERAIPSAELTIQLKNANIAAAPASCNIENTTSLNCIVPTTLPGNSQVLSFSFRYDDLTINTIDARLEAIGFIDTRTINNYAEIVVPAAGSAGSDGLTIASSDAESPAESSASGQTSVDSSGGGGQWDRDVCLLLLLMWAYSLRRQLRIFA